MEFDLGAFRREEEQKPRIKVLVGEFGSGKTELAVNLATYMQKSGLKTAVVDMDLVKPYFRTREHRQQLEADGVTVIMPQAGLAHADLPVMPQGLPRVLGSPECRVVIDVGGAKSAIVLGQVRKSIQENGCEVLMVVNVCRPFSRNVHEIVTAMRNVLLPALPLPAWSATPIWAPPPPCSMWRPARKSSGRLPRLPGCRCDGWCCRLGSMARWRKQRRFCRFIPGPPIRGTSK